VGWRVADSEPADKWHLPAFAIVEVAFTMEVSSFVVAAFVLPSEVSSLAISAFVATAEVITIASASEVAIFAIVEVVARVKPRAARKTVEPRAGADKNTAGEVSRPVVAVRRARVRIISIVAILARRGSSNVGRAGTKADHDSLCVRARRCNQANAK
jgi:hypothetical protein